MVKKDSSESVGRRDALAALLGAGSVLAFGCSSSEGSHGEALDGGVDAGADAAATPDTGASASDSGLCEASSEGEIGPYFADDSAAGFNRSAILANLDGTSTQGGVALTLNVTLVDAEKSCTPYEGAQVDIWHCNASGVYSDISSEDTSSDQWLRGYQRSDANGQLTFKTIIPGWYSGRTTHIHLRVRSSYSEASSTSDGTNTVQCFFEQAFVDTLSTTVAPYNSEGTNPTTNASDRVYSQEEDGANTLSLTGDDTNGYTASLTIYLPITTRYDGGAESGGAPGAGGLPEGGPGNGGSPGAG